MVNKLKNWQEKLEKAVTAYGEELSRMDVRDSYYNGTRDVYRDRTGSTANKKASTVWNIVYELIESQADVTIPLPRVEAVHEEDEELAKRIENMLNTVIREQHFSVMNDLQERTVPMQGGTFWHVEWDPKGGSHCVLGDVVVSDRHPKQVIPQPGITDMRDMRYVFLRLAQSVEYIKSRYGVEIKNETEEHPEVRANSSEASTVEGMCTQNIVYYKNSHGGVGLFSWVDDQVLEDYDDFLSRRLERCAVCGAVKTGPVCACGSKRFVEKAEEYEELEEPLTLYDGEVLDAEETDGTKVQTAPDGTPLLDELTGEPVELPVVRKTRIPYYKPDSIPVILRRNVRKFGSLLGVSDVDIIADQQEAIKKYGTKIEEKILLGGSFVTLPEGVNIDTSSREFKVVRLRNPADRASIGVINVQPNMDREMEALQQNYTWAKSATGITDAYQGKYDSSATSGAAKQFSANQSAGRLQSKREQKNQAYAELYKTIFQFMLAYSDQRVPISYTDSRGKRRYGHFNRYDFLRRDEAGELYWDDEFIFTIDSSATLQSNRDLLWQQMDLKFQNGAFGPLGDRETLLRYWTQLANTSYPYAEQMKKSIQDAMEREAQNAVQPMPNGAADTVLSAGGGPVDAGGDAGAGDGMPKPGV